MTAQTGDYYTVTLPDATAVSAYTPLFRSRSGIVDTNPPPVTRLLFSKGPDYIKDSFTVTADFGEPINATPTLTLSGLAATSGRFGASNTLSNPTRISPTEFVFSVDVGGTT